MGKEFIQIGQSIFKKDQISAVYARAPKEGEAAAVIVRLIDGHPVALQLPEGETAADLLKLEDFNSQ